jgi:hypothetical protein
MPRKPHSSSRLGVAKMLVQPSPTKTPVARISLLQEVLVRKDLLTLCRLAVLTRAAVNSITLALNRHPCNPLYAYRSTVHYTGSLSWTVALLCLELLFAVRGCSEFRLLNCFERYNSMSPVAHHVLWPTHIC